jgi:hypothetical protein
MHRLGGGVPMSLAEQLRQEYPQASPFLFSAVKYAELGIPVELIEANEKGCRQPNWENTCSADPKEVLTKVTKKPNWTNYALVAKAVPGGHLFLDDDGGIRAIYESQGGVMGPTLKQQSCSWQSAEPDKKIHYIYKHSPASLAFFERAQKSYIGEKNPDGKGELWSLRINDSYVVGAGSVVNGAPYTIAYDTQPIPIPDALLNFLIQRWEAANKPQPVSAPTTESEDVYEGSRNVRMTSFVGRLYRDGLDESEIYEVSSRKNQEHYHPPLDDSELRTIVHSIAGTNRPRKSELEANYDAGIEQRAAEAKAQAEQKAQVQTVLDVSNWRQEFKSVGELEKGEVQMLINNFLPEGTTFIGGLPGEGKTLLALSIAKALTTGKPFLGCLKFDVPAIVPVLYLIPEVAARAFRQRCEKFNIPDDPNLFLCRTISEGPTLLLDNPMVLEAVRKMKPVVFLDTVLRFNEAEDENASAQNKALVEDIIRLRHEGAVAIVGLHHSTKNMHKEGMLLETVLRGTGDLAAMCDAVYGLLRDDALYKHNSGPNEIDVACVKPRDFEPPEPFRIAASHRVNQPGVIGIGLGIVSYIDELGDFQIVSKAETEQAIGSWLESIVTDDPAITLAELEKSTKLSSWVIRQTLRSRGWAKTRGGAKGTTQWRKTNDSSPFNKSNSSHATYMPPSHPASQITGASFN